MENFFAAFFDGKARSAELVLMAKLHYHYKFESMDITPYMPFGMRAGI